MADFTREERKVILFLAAMALLGLGVNFTLKQFGAGESISSFSEELARVNLNSADKRLLMKISGIGEKTAQRIIDYREARCGFSAVEELKGIEGISGSKFAKIKEYLTVK